MKKDPIRRWTLLIYANGNNEYEPEMYKSMLDAERVGSNEDVNVVIQIGREKSEVIKILRPREEIEPSEASWSGVRRYYVEKQSSRLIEELGSFNMSDPKRLYEFIEWGIKAYPSEHYALLIGGHGAAFVGAITDFSGSLPCIMGTTEMCRAVNMIRKNTGKNLDLLILDMCYMNLVEIIYELGKDTENTVKRVVTYVEDGPLEGIPCGELIEKLQRNCNNDSDEIARELVKSKGLDLIGFNIHHRKLNKIKNLISSIAYAYLNSGLELPLEELIFNAKPGEPWFEYADELRDALESIILCRNESADYDKKPIGLITMNLKNMIRVYYKLGFAKGNYWTYLLCGKRIGDKLDINTTHEFKPSVMTKNAILGIILTVNPDMELNEAQKVLSRLIRYKGWKWD